MGRTSDERQATANGASRTVPAMTRLAVRPARSPTEASWPGWLALASPRSPLRLSAPPASVWLHLTGAARAVQATTEPYRTALAARGDVGAALADREHSSLVAEYLDRPYGCVPAYVVLLGELADRRHRAMAPLARRYAFPQDVGELDVDRYVRPVVNFPHTKERNSAQNTCVTWAYLYCLALYWSVRLRWPACCALGMTRCWRCSDLSTRIGTCGRCVMCIPATFHVVCQAEGGAGSNHQCRQP